MYNIHLIYNLSYQLPFLVGPLLFFFLRALTLEKWVFYRRDALHLLPFLISSLGTINNFIYAHNIILFNFPIVRIKLLLLLWLQLISIGSYTWAALRFAKNNFLKQFVLATSILATAVAIGFTFLYITHPLYYNWRWIFLSLSLYIYWVTYQFLQNRFEFLTKVNNNGKYANSGLKPSGLADLQIRLQEVMETEKLYLNSQLNIEQLAQHLHTSRHHLSQVLNEGLQKNYHDFINEYRIEAAKRFMQDPQKQHYSIAAIAFEVGFNSLSNFNLVFKKYCQRTPSQYRQQQISDTKTIPNRAD